MGIKMKKQIASPFDHSLFDFSRITTIDWVQTPRNTSAVVDTTTFWDVAPAPAKKPTEASPKTLKERQKEAETLRNNRAKETKRLAAKAKESERTAIEAKKQADFEARQAVALATLSVKVKSPPKAEKTKPLQPIHKEAPPHTEKDRFDTLIAQISSGQSTLPDLTRFLNKNATFLTHPECLGRLHTITFDRAPSSESKAELEWIYFLIMRSGIDRALLIDRHQAVLDAIPAETVVAVVNQVSHQNFFWKPIDDVAIVQVEIASQMVSTLAAQKTFFEKPQPAWPFFSLTAAIVTQYGIANLTQAKQTPLFQFGEMMGHISEETQDSWIERLLPKKEPELRTRFMSALVEQKKKFPVFSLPLLKLWVTTFNWVCSTKTRPLPEIHSIICLGFMATVAAKSDPNAYFMVRRTGLRLGGIFMDFTEADLRHGATLTHHIQQLLNDLIASAKNPADNDLIPKNKPDRMRHLLGGITAAFEVFNPIQGQISTAPEDLILTTCQLLPFAMDSDMFLPFVQHGWKQLLLCANKRMFSSPASHRVLLDGMALILHWVNAQPTEPTPNILSFTTYWALCLMNLRISSIQNKDMVIIDSALQIVIQCKGRISNSLNPQSMEEKLIQCLAPTLGLARVASRTPGLTDENHIHWMDRLAVLIAWIGKADRKLTIELKDIFLAVGELILDHPTIKLSKAAKQMIYTAGLRLQRGDFNEECTAVFNKIRNQGMLSPGE